MPAALQLSLRRALIKAITQHVEARSKIEQTAARKLGLSKPRLNTLLKGLADAFSLDMPVGPLR